MGFAAFGAILGAAGSLVQGVMSAQAASAQAKVANEQLKIDMENDKIRAANEENDRIEMFQRAEGANAVASALAVGGGQNFSYQQGIQPFNKSVVARDVATIGYNKDMAVGRAKYQIAVNKFTAKTEGRMAMVSGLFGAVDSLAGMKQVGSYKSTGGGLLS
jgi:hypothetical protein